MNKTNKVTKAGGKPELPQVVRLDKQGPYAWGVAQSDKLITQGLSKQAAESLARQISTKQAQSSPLPVTHSDVVMDLIAQYDELNRHAQALADALKPFAFSVKGEMHDDAEVYRIGNWNVYGRDVNAAKQALAAWEGAQS